MSAPNQGTKVTTDPRTQSHPKNENPGIVTSDSLAGESITAGGSFAANSHSRGAMNQPSRSVNTATTDTSNATTLPAAADSTQRGRGGDEEETYQGGSGGVGYTKAGGAGRTYVPAAAAGGGEEGKRPKGKNLTEGGFDGDAPNASFNTEIGTKKDPGRVALNAFEARNVGVSGGAGARGQKVGEGTAFDALGGDTGA